MHPGLHPANLTEGCQAFSEPAPTCNPPALHLKPPTGPQENDRGDDKIRQLIDTLDMRKDEAIERTFKGVAKQFRDIFAQVGGAICGDLGHHLIGQGWRLLWAVTTWLPAPIFQARHCLLCESGDGHLPPTPALSWFLRSSNALRTLIPCHPQLVPGGRGELVMQKRLPGAGGPEDENDDPEVHTGWELGLAVWCWASSWLLPAAPRA